MKTRFTSLVKLKKDAMEKCERDFQQRERSLHLAKEALRDAIETLNSTATPISGAIAQLLQSRTLIDVQRGIVAKQQQQLLRAEAALEDARMALKSAMIEFEKFKFLEAEQIKVLIEKQKRQAQRELDEIAVQNYGIRKGSDGLY
jgi:flagellar export protein FliJ